MSRIILPCQRSLMMIAACLLVLLGFAGKSSAVTLLASFEQPVSSTSYPNTQGSSSTVQFEIGYGSTTLGVFDGPVFATSIFDFTGQPTTILGAGFPNLQSGVVDGLDDSILIKRTVTSSTSGPFVHNQTLTESLWISGGTTGLPGPDLTGFTLSNLVLTVSQFSFRQSGTSATLSYGFKYELFGEQNAATVPVPLALPLLVSGLGGLCLLGWRRKRLVAV